MRLLKINKPLWAKTFVMCRKQEFLVCDLAKDSRFLMRMRPKSHAVFQVPTVLTFKRPVFRSKESSLCGVHVPAIQLELQLH